MATPLSSFSKYGGVMMAVLCVMLMFAFVIGDPLMQYAGGGSGGGARAGGTVATWNGGQMNERQLDQAVIHRNVLAQFQQAVYQQGTREAIESGVDVQFSPLRVQPLELPRSREEGVESHVVRTKVFAQRAQEAGMVVSNDMIIDYLRAIGRDRVGNDQMRQILGRMSASQGRTATIDFMFDLLREAILANNYLRSYGFIFETVLPAERWEDWRKVNERVVIEAAPLPIESLLDEVAEPSDEELQSFFDEYKDRQPSPEVLRGLGNVELPSATPGFAIPPRVRLAYLKADFNAVVAQVADGVTDEEIAAYYEENRESFIEADRALFGDDDGGLSGLLGDDSGLTEDDSSEGPGGTPPAAPAGKEATEDRQEGNEDDLPGADLVEEEEEEEESTDEGGDESEAQPADDKPYQPLEEVADVIRQRIAIERAAEAVRDKMRGVETVLDDAFADYFEATLEAGDEADAVEPPAPLNNLKPLAEENELELVEIDQASQLELRETPIGQSIVANSSAQRPVPTWFVAFRPDDIDLYQPRMTFDSQNNVYLILVTKRYEGEEPELADVRDDVVAAWKRTKAAELALEKAKALAAEASESGKPLKDFLAGAEDAPISADDVVETDAFAYLTAGRVAPTAMEVPLRLSQPEPLVAPGPQLLETAVGLEAGEVAAELNHDHSIAYLLRVAQKMGTDAELRREFLRDGENWLGAASLNRARSRSKISAVVSDLLAESELEWERTPDRLR